MKLKNFDRTCARDGSHGLQGQCEASAEHRSDSGVADSATRRDTPKIKNCNVPIA
ncbi:MAG: hypothetical protein NZ529_04350 [Cytophagaceae bacterium]|nr:hypothetical protein [Cytophagaceae bacterium]MDW8456005.1 hypothetical protein [Cytophagaceae bacterium]